MTVVTQASGTPPTPEQVLQDIMCECHRNTQPAPGDGCAELGEKKHACCEAAIANRTPPPEIGGEKGYDAAGNALGMSRSAAKAGGVLKGTAWPDACATSGGNPTQFFDFKFICPGGTKYFDKAKGVVKFASGRGTADANFYFPAGRSQYDKYKKLGDNLKPPTTGDPKPITSRAC